MFVTNFHFLKICIYNYNIVNLSKKINNLLSFIALEKKEVFEVIELVPVLPEFNKYSFL